MNIQIEDILIQVEPKRMKTLRLSVKRDGRVHISCPLFTSEKEVIRFATQHIDWIRATQEKMRQREAERPAPQPILPEEAQRFAWRLDAILKAAILETGLHINGYKIKLMRTEWGSCNPRTKSLVFNLALARMSDECIRYVVIHELCHLVVPNHSPAFWREVEKYCPNWKELRKSMRKH